jgi:hypothetical protein
MLKALHQIIYSPKNIPQNSKYSFVSKIDDDYMLIYSKKEYNLKELNIIDTFKKSYYRGVLSNFLLFCLYKRRTKRSSKNKKKGKKNKYNKNKHNKKRRNRKKKNW